MKIKIKKEDLELIDSRYFQRRYYVVAGIPKGIRIAFAECELRKMFLEYGMDKYEIQEPNGETIDMECEFNFTNESQMHEIIAEYYSYIEIEGNEANG